VRKLVTLVLLAWLALLAACGENDAERNASQQPQGASLRITLGTQEFPEARILGELWRIALAVHGYTVDLRKCVGPAEELDQALRDDEIDGYGAYTGTVLSIVGGEEVSGLDPEETYEQAKEYYAGQDMAMSEMTPFQNKDAIATTEVFAQREGLRSIADLRRVDGLTLGARPEFEDLELGLLGLKERYGLTDVRFRPLELGTQFAALYQGEVDAVNAFTTYPQLRDGAYAILDDPQLLVGSQNVVMTVRREKLESVG